MTLTALLLGDRRGAAAAVAQVVAAVSSACLLLGAFPAHAATGAALENHPPVISPLGSFTLTAGTGWHTVFTVSDPDNDPVVVSADTLPPGAQAGGCLVNGSCTLEWMPSLTQTGSYLAVLRATDPFGASDTEAVALTVVAPAQPVRAWLSWSATTNGVTDTAPGKTEAKLFVRFDQVNSYFKGGEIDVTWSPAGDNAGCFDHVGTVYRTSSGTACTYLNRGSAVPVISFDDPDHFHVAWSNSSAITGCTEGTALEIDFEMDACPAQTGCFSLNSASILSAGGFTTQALIAGPVATVGGGSSYCPAGTAADSTGRPAPDGAPPEMRLGVENSIARARAVVHWALTRDAPARLGVYDARGRRVRVLADGWQNAGEQSAAWDLRSATGVRVPAGVYVVRLVAGEGSRSVRLLALP